MHSCFQHSPRLQILISVLMKPHIKYIQQTTQKVCTSREGTAGVKSMLKFAQNVLTAKLLMLPHLESWASWHPSVDSFYPWSFSCNSSSFPPQFSCYHALILWIPEVAGYPPLHVLSIKDSSHVHPVSVNTPLTINHYSHLVGRLGSFHSMHFSCLQVTLAFIRW